MKKLFLSILAVAGIATMNAQIANVESVTPLLKGVESDMHHPVLSVDGSRLLFSSCNYTGLRMYDFNDNVVTKVSNEDRAGFDATFSPDGSEIYFVTQTRDGVRNLRQVKKYDIASRQITEMTQQGRVVGRPVATAKGFATTVDGTLVATDKKATRVRTEGAQLFITQNGVEKAYSPIENCVGYIWASLSPDGSKVMFFAAAHGIVITDLNGNILSMPGNYEAPVWYGNNHIVAMNATNDGYNYHSSQIVLLSVDGYQKQELTKPESMTMNPTASFEAGKIVYATIDGRLYQMNINLK
jgi:Tol biopolymer transport system component